MPWRSGPNVGSDVAVLAVDFPWFAGEITGEAGTAPVSKKTVVDRACSQKADSGSRIGRAYTEEEMKELRETGMDIQAVETYEDFLSLEGAWNNLLEKSHSDTVFLRHEWFRCWWLAFGKHNRMLILLIRENGELVGIAPLMITAAGYRGMPLKRIGFIENENTPRSDFILTRKPEHAITSIVRYLNNHRNRWQLIYLRNLPADSPNSSILRSVLKQNHMPFSTKKDLCSPVIQVCSDWDSYFKSRSKNFRKVLRNKMNRVSRLGSYTIEKHEQPEDARPVLSAVLEISKNSWKAREQTDLATDQENKRFFHELTRVVRDKGWLNIWLLKANGTPIAYEFHLRYKNRVHALRADFHESYRDNHPGSVLDAHIVKSVFEDNVKEYDLGGSSDLYKQKWTSAVRKHEKFIIFRRGLLGYLLYLLEFKAVPFLRRSELMRRWKKTFEAER